MIDSVERFLRQIEKVTGRSIPRVPPDPSNPDDCPICRALGMQDGPEDGVVDLGGMQVLTVRLDRNGFPEADGGPGAEPRRRRKGPRGRGHQGPVE